MKIQEFNNTNLNALRSQVPDYLEDLSKELGVTFNVVGNISYNDLQATLKIEVCIDSPDKNDARLEQINKQLSWGGVDGRVGDTFSFQGKKYKIVSFNPRARKYPVKIKRVSDGKKYAMTVDQVNACIK